MQRQTIPRPIPIDTYHLALSAFRLNRPTIRRPEPRRIRR